MNAHLPAGNEVEGSAAASSYAKQTRPWFISLLLLQGVLLGVRWHLGDAHGALLMFAACAVGVLALSVGDRGVDEVYGGYYGLMALVSGLLDLNLAVESIVWGEWRQFYRQPLAKANLASLVKPALYLLCAAVQVMAAFVAYLLYKDADGDAELEAQEPMFATLDQARIYSAVLSHGDRQLLTQPAAAPNPSAPRAFCGAAHKLP